MTTNREKSEFRGYLRNCTNNQVQGVYDKEKAGRLVYARLAVEGGTPYYYRKVSLLWLVLSRS
jgi:hypothetical protein